MDAGKGSRACVAARQLPARSALLLRLPAQHLHHRAGRLACAGRHRLPLHGDLDGPQHRHLHPHGWRRRDVGRAGRVHRYPARVPEPGRRHLFPQRIAGDPPGDRGRRQHHLQDPLQRRGGDDRRAAGGRPAERAGHRKADACRGHPHHHGAVGQHHQVDAPARAFPQRRGVPRPQRAGCGAEAPARSEGCFDPDLRTDLRHREAPPPQARQAGRSGQAGDDQFAGLRRLRRLRQEELLRVGAAEGNRVRAQARHRPVQLQQGLFLRQRLLPELRHRARWTAAQGQQARCLHPAGQPAGTGGARHPGAALEHPDHRRWRHRRGDHRRPAGHGRSP
ncbi:hypothetical protein D3C72_981840 [compost metagenome]